MIVPRLLAVTVLALAPLLLQGCAIFQRSDPLQVTVAGIEPMEGQGQGLELRLLVKLRVQNPNDTPIDYNGVALEITVQGKTFATGVSDASGTVPRFGESVITVPVTASAFRMLGGAFAMIRGGAIGSGKITYEMTGKLNSSGFNSTHFRTQGEFDLAGTSATGNGSGPP
jgi:LEA14-like dessication related protein